MLMSGIKYIKKTGNRKSDSNIYISTAGFNWRTVKNWALHVQITPNYSRALHVQITPKYSGALHIVQMTPKNSRALHVQITPKYSRALHWQITPNYSGALHIQMTPKNSRALHVQITLKYNGTFHRHMILRAVIVFISERRCQTGKNSTKKVISVLLHDIHGKSYLPFLSFSSAVPCKLMGNIQ